MGQDIGTSKVPYQIPARIPRIEGGIVGSLPISSEYNTSRPYSGTSRCMPSLSLPGADAAAKALARKAEGASAVGFFTPTPPNLTGNEAWVHMRSSSWRLTTD